MILYDDSPIELAKKIREKKIDIAIMSFLDTKIALATLLAGIKTRVAPATKIAQIFVNKRIKQRRSQVKMREFEYNIELLKAVFPEINTQFTKPVLEFTQDEKHQIYSDFRQKFNIDQDANIVCFHSGFGGSSDGNLTIDDYIKLARGISGSHKIVFSFGPDDNEAYSYIKEHLDFDAILWRSDLSLIDFAKLLSNFKLFVSTSTGPMHLAGAVNTPTMSFFGNTLFASDKRWGTINDTQMNFCIDKDYDEAIYFQIEQKLREFLARSD